MLRTGLSGRFYQHRRSATDETPLDLFGQYGAYLAPDADAE